MILAFSVPVAIILILFAFVFIYQIKNTILPLTEEMSSEIVLNRAVQINDRLEEYLREAGFLAKAFFGGYAIDVSTLETSKLTHYQSLIRSDIINRKRGLREGINDVFFVDPLGNRYGGDGSMSLAKDTPYFQAILVENRVSFVTNPYFNSEGEPVLDVLQEVRNDDGQKVGLLGIQVPFDILSRFALDARIGHEGYGWITDAQGLVITHPDPDLALNLNLLEAHQQGYQGLEAVGQLILKKEGGAATITLPQGTKQLVFFQPIPGPAQWTLAISMPLEAILGRTDALRMFTFGAFALLIVLSLLVAVVMSNNVVKPVQLMAQGLNEISGGDLSSCVELTRADEVGQMASSFNQMITTLREIVAGITNAIEAISQDTATLARVSESNSASLTQVASTTVQFATTAEQSSERAQRMSEQAQDSLVLADQGMKQIELSGEIMVTIDQTAKQSVQAIRSLQKETSKIGEMIDSISDIAEQTNLLALNAAIEAARAGEEGRGFSVVAQEVRNLAEQTQALVTEVRSIMEAVSVQADRAVEVSAANDREVDRGTGVLAETKQAFTSIAANIEETVRSFEEVAKATQELAQGSGEISIATERQSDSVDEVAKVAVSVGRMVEELKVLVGKFKM